MQLASEKANNRSSPLIKKRRSCPSGPENDMKSINAIKKDFFHGD